MNYNVRIGERTFVVEVGDLAARPIRATIDGETFEVWPAPAAEPAATNREADQRLKTQGAAPAAPPRPAESAGPEAVLAPIPGVIISVAVRAGDTVTVGQELCVLEAMKMKSPIRAPRAGTLAAVRISAGQQVKHREALVDYAR
ncbi:MAG: acetyl-CoA carboxylase biotin carboxyl carrier protein subunit [Anaerolineales bacterium]|nr:acetyl-CoA carboxylase biotin carboxyl carrier protein subunit [Anaerolineales bacterium]